MEHLNYLKLRVFIFLVCLPCAKCFHLSSHVILISPLQSSPTVLCLVPQSCPTLCDPVDCGPPGSSVPRGFSRQEYWSGLPYPPPGDLSNPGIKPRSPALQMESLLSEPPGKPKNTGVDSLSLLQGIFPTQELNRGLLHYR